MEADSIALRPEAARPASTLQKARRQGHRRRVESDGRRAEVKLSSVATHLHLEELGDPTEVVTQASEAGVTRLVAMGVDLERSRMAVDLARQHEEVWAGIGHHPTE